MFTTPTITRVFALALLFAGALQTGAFTVDDLRSDTTLTPARLLAKFAEFKFRLADEVQPAEQFLAAAAGDCDDFATLAADILSDKGYTARLMVVFMRKETHVVCYVAEEGGYLDFNNRANESPLVKCGETVAEVAESVAQSFRSEWHCAAEFSFRAGKRRFIYTDFCQEQKVERKS